MRWHRNQVAALVLAATVFGSVAYTEPPKPEDESRALLLLSMARRERERTAALANAADGRGCFTKQNDAIAAAAKRGKPVVYWVGMKCEDRPNIRAILPDAIHCHLRDWNGNDSPRLIVQDASEPGSYYYFPKSDLTAESGPVIRRLAGLPPSPSK